MFQRASAMDMGVCSLSRLALVTLYGSDHDPYHAILTLLFPGTCQSTFRNDQHVPIRWVLLYCRSSTGGQGGLILSKPKDSWTSIHNPMRRTGSSKKQPLASRTAMKILNCLSDYHVSSAVLNSRTCDTAALWLPTGNHLLRYFSEHY